MKNIFRFAAIAAAAFALLSCEKDPQTDSGTDKPNNGSQTTTPEYTENLTFTLTQEEVEADQAKFKVETNGTTKDTWCYFATTESDIEKAIADKIAEGGLTLKKNTSTSVTVRNLEAETEYTFVVVGVTADGKKYGTPATLEFTTTAVPEPEPEPTPDPTPEPGEFAINPNWTVTYIGEYEEGGKVYEDVVAVETTDTNPFFVTAWPVDYLEEYGIEAITATEIEAWNELIAQYPGATFADVVYTESILTQVLIDPEYGTKWYAMAIGCDTNGEATGLYALSEVIDLENLGGGEDEEPTEGYAAWLGDWTITGANGLTQNVTFSKGKTNQTFIMTGYEGDDAAGLDVTVDWMEEENCWVIYNQKLGTYNFGNYGPGEIWFIGEDAEENLYLSTQLPICIGGLFEDGSYGALGFEGELQSQDGSVVTFKVAQMEYLAYLTNYGQLSYVTGTYETGYPTFPLTFTPATKASTYSVNEFKGGKKTLYNPFAPKMTFKTFGFNNSHIIR